MRRLPGSMRMGAAGVIIGAVAAVGCTRSDSEPSGTSAGKAVTAEEARETLKRAELLVVDGKLQKTTWVMQDALYGLPDRRSRTKLEGVVNSPFVGTLSPAAVPSPGKAGAIAYNTFLRKRPVLRVHDLRSGKDSIVDVGTFSLAWSRDGALAYFKGLKPRVDDPVWHPGHVVVRRGVRAPPVRWTAAAGQYVVSAWAGQRLVVHERQGDGWPNLVLFDGPGRKRVLAERAALVALSPDGSRAFVTKQPDPAAAVGVVDVATGDEVASFAFTDEVDPIRSQPIDYVGDSGAWAAERVIAAVTSGLAVFRVGDEEVVLEELLAVDPEAFPLGLTEPKSEETGRYVFAAAQLQQRPRATFPRVALMECDRVERRCVLGRSGPAFLPPRPVYNPSRPLAG